jgi:hypothetical protein
MLGTSAFSREFAPLLDRFLAEDVSRLQALHVGCREVCQNHDSNTLRECVVSAIAYRSGGADLPGGQIDVNEDTQERC